MGINYKRRFEMEKLIFKEKTHEERAIIRYYEKQVNQFKHEIIIGDFKRHVIKRHGDITLPW